MQSVGCFRALHSESVVILVVMCVVGNDRAWKGHGQLETKRAKGRGSIPIQRIDTAISGKESKGGSVGERNRRRERICRARELRQGKKKEQAVLREDEKL